MLSLSPFSKVVIIANDRIPPSSSDSSNHIFSIGLHAIGGYNVSVLVFIPLDIYILPFLQLIHASTVANQGHPKINGCPPNGVLVCITINSTRYSH